MAQSSGALTLGDVDIAAEMAGNASCCLRAATGRKCRTLPEMT